MLRKVVLGWQLLAALAAVLFGGSLATAQVPTLLSGDGHAIAMTQFAADGKTLVSIDDHGHVVVWDLPAGTRRSEFQLKLPIAHALAVSNDGSRLIVAGPGGRLHLLSATDGAESAASEIQPGSIHAITLSPDGANVAAGSGVFASRGTITINTAADLTRRHIVADFAWPSYALAWSPDGNWLATGGGRVLQPAEAWLLDAATGKPEKPFVGGRDVVRTIAFAPDSAAVAMAGRDGSIRTFEVPSGKPLLCITPVAGEVVALSYTDEGRQIAAVLGNGSIRVWDAASGKAITSICAPQAIVGQASFSRDGKLLAIGTKSGEVELYEIATLANWRVMGGRRGRPCDMPVCDAPNIVLIVADDLGYGELGVYGQVRIQTPQVDRLAAEGMRFTDYYAGSPYGIPSRATLLTGLTTGHARIRGNDKPVPLAPGDITVAEMLRATSYATCAIGRWDMGDKDSTGAPRKQGFGEFYGFYNAAEAADSYPDAVWRNDVSEAIPENAGGATKLDSPELLTRAALKFIDENRNQPFFLYVVYPQPRTSVDLVNDAPYTNEPWPDAAKKHAAAITRVDAAIGAIARRIDDHNLRTNTLFIVTSDNGPVRDATHDPALFNSTGGLRGERGDVYEGGIRVPLVARWPRRIRPGQTTAQPAAHFDLLPTFAEVAGSRHVPRMVDGVSLAPLFTGGQLVEADAYRPIYVERHDGGFKQAVRFGQWKAIRSGLKGTIELFDLNTDLAEETDIAADSPDLVAEAETLLNGARTPSPDWPVEGE